MTDDNYSVLDISEVQFWTIKGKASIGGRAEGQDLTIEDLGNIAEWLAFAWENLAGEQYKPVAFSSGGYVYDDGNGMITQVSAGDYIVPKHFLGFSERDCE